MDSDIQSLIDVDRLIHEPARLVLVSMLYAVESADFTFLLRQSGLTKGNLSAHLSRLEQAGYIEVSKGYRGRVPQTAYSLTPTGRTAFQKYRARLKRAVDSMPE
jgi:DNA-binding MarR family transcriptional regulator